MDTDILSGVHTLGNTYWFPHNYTSAQREFQTGRRHRESPYCESKAMRNWLHKRKAWLLGSGRVSVDCGFCGRHAGCCTSARHPPPPNPIQSAAIHVRELSRLRVALPKGMTPH